MDGQNPGDTEAKGKRMPAGEAPHPRPGNPCGVCWEVLDENGAPPLGHDRGCHSAEQLHWFCSPCIMHFHACPLCPRPHPFCTALPPRKTQSDDLTLHTLRTLIAQNVWARDAGPALTLNGWTSSATMTRRHDHLAPPGAHQRGRCQSRGRTPRSTLQTTIIMLMRHGAVYPPWAICQTVGAPSAP